MLGLHPADQLDAVHAGQPLVGEHEVGVVALEQVDRVLAARRHEHVVAGHLERALERTQEDLVVLDEQDPTLHARHPLRRPRGDHEADGRAAPRQAVDLDLAVVQVHDLLHDRHPEAGARRLRREERQEDLLALLGRHADAVVAHLDDGVRVPRRNRRTSTRARACRSVASSAFCTTLAKTCRRRGPSTAATRSASIWPARRLDAALLARRPAQPATTSSRIRASGYSWTVEPGVARVVEQVRDDRLDLGDARHDRVRHLLRDAIVRRLARGEEPRGHLDAAQRVADLVGDARRHLAERRELLALDQPLLRRHLLGEVAQHADGADDLAAGRRTRRRARGVPGTAGRRA